jgi:drug/metabolite transporter (DMT)-like permease
LKPILLGVLAAFFFAFTFVLNRAMELSGGSWIWSASLRYFFMVPFLILIVIGRKKLRPLFSVMKEQPVKWLLWSFVGFGLFYAPICFAAAYTPGWLVAATWQITIISGSLLAPLFYETVHTNKGPLRVKGKIPLQGMLFSSFILIGVIMMQMEQAKTLSLSEMILGTLPVLIATFAYPLGNRKMMEICQGRLDTYQRVLGMTIASLPFWLILSLIEFMRNGAPSQSQVFQSGLVAIFSGVIATVLFFMATDMVNGNMQKLAAVEATQSIEILFALFGEMVFLSLAVPSTLAWSGMLIVIMGVVFHSYTTHHKEIRSTRDIAEKA